MLIDFGHNGTEDLNIHSIQFNQTIGGLANSIYFYLTFIDDNTFNVGLCTIGASFQVEGDLEIITSKKSYFGGIIPGGSTVTIHRMPPEWSTNDSFVVNNYMHYLCARDLAQKWGLKPFPPLPVH